MATVLEILIVGLRVYLLLLLARVVLDLVRLFARDYRPHGFMLVVFESVFTVTDPPLKALRRLIPPLRIGQVALDIGFLLLFIGLQILIGVLTSVLHQVT